MISRGTCLLVAGIVGLGTVLTTRRSADSCGLTGDWLTTLAFAGRRPVYGVISFQQTEGRFGEPPNRGCWVKTGADTFSITFRLPVGELEAGARFEYRVKGTWTLDGLGRLRGPVTGEVLDPAGRCVDSLRGTAKATRIVPQKDMVTKSVEEEITTLGALDLSGGPVATRTPDLYRVKVNESACTPSMNRQVIDSRVMGLSQN